MDGLCACRRGCWEVNAACVCCEGWPSIDPREARLYGVPATAFERTGLDGFECTSELMDIPGDDGDLFLYCRAFSQAHTITENDNTPFQVRVFLAILRLPHRI